MSRRDRVKGRLHLIERDIAGNLGIAWTVEAWDWPSFYRWMGLWT